MKRIVRACRKCSESFDSPFFNSKQYCEKCSPVVNNKARYRSKTISPDKYAESVLKSIPENAELI